MIATGTDVKPLEIVMFMRSVKSRSFFRAEEGPARVCAFAATKRRNPARRRPPVLFDLVRALNISSYSSSSDMKRQRNKGGSKSSAPVDSRSDSRGRRFEKPAQSSSS
jgi:type I site-specific restriction endonuclease